MPVGRFTLLPPEPGSWGYSVLSTGTRFDIEHIADDEPENPQPYWHVQELTVAELLGTVATGLGAGVGIELRVPFRVVRDRVHYLDLNREPYTPPNPGLHHRNETVSGFADPVLAIHLGRRGTSWSIGGRVGLSIPVGKTEPNPFELGRQGLWHQHIQFGTGTWDPVLEVAADRPIGAFNLELSGAARLVFFDNDHGYEAGDRYALRAVVGRGLGKAWNVNGGLLLAHETAETWGGQLETEGNLGRTDLFVSLGGGVAVGSRGRLFANVQVTVASHANGHQVDIPAILSFGWSY